jgi:hypothetical protein
MIGYKKLVQFIRVKKVLYFDKIVFEIGEATRLFLYP